MRLPFFSKTTTTTTTAFKSPRSWPIYCQQPKTLSFRENDDNLFLNNTTTSSSDLDETTSLEIMDLSGTDPIDSVVKGLKSDRLFFEPERTSSILEVANYNKARGSLSNIVPFKESVTFSMDSRDPYFDFKKSMEEMVEAHGLKDRLEELQELLCCYLRVNGKSNHGYILCAFVDLLVGLAFTSTSNINNPSSTSTSTSSSSHECPCSFSRSPSSPLSFYTSSSSCCSASSSSYECSSHPCVSSSVLEVEEIDVLPCSSSLVHEIEMDEN